MFETPVLSPETEAQVEKVKIKDHTYTVEPSTPENESILLEQYRNTYNTDQGFESIRFRYGFILKPEGFMDVYRDDRIEDRVILKDESGEIAGWGEYFIDPTAPTVAEISRFVFPQYQRKGIGTWLINRLFEEIQTRHPEVKKVVSRVEVDNTAVQKNLNKIVEQHKQKYQGQQNVGAEAGRSPMPVEGRYLYTFHFPRK